MDVFTTGFLADAKAGKTVFIADVRDAYLTLPPEKSFACDLFWLKADGGARAFRLRLPRFHAYSDEGAAFVRDYFFAQIHNIFSAMGGRRAYMANPEGALEAEALISEFALRFQVGRARDLRDGYGRCLNVNDRMLRALAPETAVGGFSLILGKPETDAAPPAAAAPVSGAAEVFRRSFLGLEGKALLGMDIGGTDIKLALALDGRLAALKEFDWFPAHFTRADELIRPIFALVELMGVVASAATRRDATGKIREAIDRAMSREADVAAMRGAIALYREKTGRAGVLFDGIGVSFPDVVVADKIVGGESPKTRGMRDALGSGYEDEFAKVTELAARLAPFVKEGGRVGIANDGPMAAFTAGAEMAAADPARVKQGVFAHTLGTDLGTGWVDESGRIPDIPLEAYNFIIDLGSYPERAYLPDDVRSVNSFNSGLPGCSQKYASQSGVFRLAVKHFSESRPDLLDEIREAGYVRAGGAGGEAGQFVPTAPRDMRKPFLEFMMELVEREKDPVVDRVFGDVGAALAAVCVEIDWILALDTPRRFLFGRLVKKDSCFRLIARGAVRTGSRLELVVADDGLAETPLMRALGATPGFTVAQFAQAVGAVHYANCRLLNKS